MLVPSLNGGVQVALQQIDELARNIDELTRLATVPETAESVMSDIARFGEKIKMLPEFIKTEKAKQITAQKGSVEIEAVLERLTREKFTLTEYEDVVIHSWSRGW